MKIGMIWIVGITILSAGFFNEEEEQIKQKMLENERLCKLFRQKAEEYKKHMRNDVLAKTTLASYYHRAQLFCDRAKDLNATLHEIQSGE